jgi:hypothetical protein
MFFGWLKKQEAMKAEHPAFMASNDRASFSTANFYLLHFGLSSFLGLPNK